MPRLPSGLSSSCALLVLSLLLASCSEPPVPATRPSAATSAKAQDAIDASTSAVLKGDNIAALDALRSAPKDQFAPEDAAYRACMLDRFGSEHAPAPVKTLPDAFAQQVLTLYQRYWWQALTTPAHRPALARQLEHDLRKLLHADVDKLPDMEAVEAALSSKLVEDGYHAQLGLTPPLQDLMLWKRQQTRRYRVELPEGPQTVDVDLLDDFASRGWSSYGRCERGSTGGWATDEKLYAVVPSYTKDGGLDSEAFRVVFLGHEAQHFADQNRWPDMPPWDLEYRAKLVEMAQARQVSAKRLRGFLTAQGDDTISPHTHANKRVVAALSTRLGRAPDQVSIDALQAAAKAALLADTARREAARR